MTDANFDNASLFSFVDECLVDICTYFQMTAFPIGRDLDLVLDIVTSAEGDLTCRYYLANHQDRSITWLDTFDAAAIFSPVQTQVSPSLAGMCFFFFRIHSVATHYTKPRNWNHSTGKATVFLDCELILFPPVEQLSDHQKMQRIEG